MNDLHWHRAKETGGPVRAWATRLNPEDRLPPYYRIVKVGSNQPVRCIELVTRSSATGSSVTEVGVADNLVKAKALAQADYEGRMKQ